MELIRLYREDLRRSLFRDVVYLLFSESGAMPQPGTVYFITRQGRLYGFDYLYGDVELDDILPLFPPLAQSRFVAFGSGSTVPPGWHYLYLGVGNHLMIDESVYPEFQEQLIDYRNNLEVLRDWRILARRTLPEEPD